MNIVNLIDSYCERLASEEDRRHHLGYSGLGHFCERKIWLDFRWATPIKTPGRVWRIFSRGKAEEEAVLDRFAYMSYTEERFAIKNLASQIKCPPNGHLGGTADALIEIEGIKYVLEIKTHNQKSFDDLIKHGLIKSKRQHYVQLIIYIMTLNIDKGIYFAVNKNDDNIYTEEVERNDELAERYIRKGKFLALSQEIPPVIGNDETWFQCRQCDYGKFCYSDVREIYFSCRTCEHVRPLPDGKWTCEKYGNEIKNEDWQKLGEENYCDGYKVNLEFTK
jgi:hypothetical protein